MPADALTTLRRALPELRERFGIADMSLFGSAARGRQRNDSDVDILVTFNPAARVTLRTLSALGAAARGTPRPDRRCR